MPHWQQLCCAGGAAEAGGCPPDSEQLGAMGVRELKSYLQQAGTSYAVSTPTPTPACSLAASQLHQAMCHDLRVSGQFRAFRLLQGQAD